jgi:hypothetical protein
MAKKKEEFFILTAPITKDLYLTMKIRAEEFGSRKHKIEDGQLFEITCVPKINKKNKNAK